MSECRECGKTDGCKCVDCPDCKGEGRCFCYSAQAVFICVDEAGAHDCVVCGGAGKLPASPAPEARTEPPRLTVGPAMATACGCGSCSSTWEYARGTPGHARELAARVAPTAAQAALLSDEIRNLAQSLALAPDADVCAALSARLVGLADALFKAAGTEGQ